MTTAEAKAAVAKYGSQSAAARALGVGRMTVHDACHGKRMVNKVSHAPTDKPATGAKVKTLSDFRATYDKATIIPAKLKAALKLLGGSGWEYEVQFARNAGVSLTDLANFREMFAANIVNLRDNRRAWAGSAGTAKTMREMI
jgi:DNA-binding transcriptional regulator YdaS (Cro superfamily)